MSAVRILGNKQHLRWIKGNRASANCTKMNAFHDFITVNSEDDLQKPLLYQTTKDEKGSY